MAFSPKEMKVVGSACLVFSCCLLMFVWLRVVVSRGRFPSLVKGGLEFGCMFPLVYKIDFQLS